MGTSVGAQLATPVPGAQTWHVLVNNVSPDGENWSFNTFYPDNLQAHPGDTIVFTLAPNPQAFHTVHGPDRGHDAPGVYQGFSGGFIQSDLTRPAGGWQSPYFGIEAGPPPCGRAGQDPCLFNATTLATRIGIWAQLRRPRQPAAGRRRGQHRRSRSRWIPALLPGPYYFTSIVDGPTMSGRIDVVAPDQPVQSAGELAAAAQRQYEADLAWLAGLDRVSNPAGGIEPGRHEDVAGRRRR